jgi:hypothetical protein
MGLDGGTIATRSDILRRSSWRLAHTDSSHSTRGGEAVINYASEIVPEGSREVALSLWEHCALSGEPLGEVNMTVACYKGMLYNREVGAC